MRSCAIIPAFSAEASIGPVVRETRSFFPGPGAVIVVDDGSRDETAERARAAGAEVIRHAENAGKGAAMRTGLRAAQRAGFEVAVTLDADGQHPPEEALRLLDASGDPAVLVLGVRDLEGAGAPRANQRSNAISNLFLSGFARRRLADTQCGLRRYPVQRTLLLGGRDRGYAFEAEIILRALAAGVPIVEVPVRVVYPPGEARVTHFDSVRDPARIVARVVRTLAATGGMRRAAPGLSLQVALLDEIPLAPGFSGATGAEGEAGRVQAAPDRPSPIPAP